MWAVRARTSARISLAGRRLRQSTNSSWISPMRSEILAEVRARTAHIAGVVLDVRKQESGPPGGKPVQVQLSSRFPQLLAPAVERLRAHMQAQPGLVDITDTRPVPGIEWQVRVDRAEASRFGADITTVGNAIQLVTNGIKVGEYRPDDTDEEVDIRVRYPADDPARAPCRRPARRRPRPPAPPSPGGRRCG